MSAEDTPGTITRGGPEIDSPVAAIDDTARALPAAPEKAQQRVSPVSGRRHEPGPRRMIGRALAEPDCWACGKRWPCPDSWQSRALAAEGKVLEYENAITWNTTCLSCSALLDSGIRETERRERAEAKLAEVTAYCQVRADKSNRTLPRTVHVADILAIIGSEEESRPCSRCDGCGQLADTDDREPWTAWTALPLRSSAAVLLGQVKPVPCDACGGTGRG